MQHYKKKLTQPNSVPKNLKDFKANGMYKTSQSS